MADALRVTDVRLTPLSPEQVTAAMTDAAPAWYDLTIAVRNDGAAPLFVLASVRRLHYDDSSRRLLVDLSEHEAGETEDAGMPFAPRLREVAGGDETTISYRLSSPITVVETVGGRLRPRFVRIPEDVDSIDVTVAADTAPPRLQPNLASHEPTGDLRRWGHLARRSLRPGRPADSAPENPTA
ncbi:MAG TPA: hypothetical protein VLM05_14280 [Mycobacteriales bacterium]|nr:hypothetical protein [Mycobacteriales bacterium]